MTSPPVEPPPVEAPQRRPTLKDVARRCGVSVISASRAMRASPHVSAELRGRVESAAAALGYRPNRIAGSLRAQSASLVAVIVPSVRHEVFAEVLDGVDDALAGSPFRQVLGISHYDLVREEEILRDLLSWQPAGVIIAGLEHTEAARALLGGCASPVVEFMDIDGEPIDLCVGASQAEAGAMMARHLLERGRRRIGYVGAWGERPARSLKRRLAFEAALADAGAPLAARLIMDEASGFRVGREACAELLRRRPDLDAIFFANDDLAVGALMYCKEAGIDVPGAVALAGFNGLDLNLAVRPALTTIESPRYEIGQTAGRLVRERLGGRADLPRVNALPLRLRQGETT